MTAEKMYTLSMRRIISIFTLSLLCIAASEPSLPYSDVPNNAWYAEAIRNLLKDGRLDASQKKFRPADFATRAEFLRLTLTIAEKNTSTPPLIPSFDDTKNTSWYYATLEEAGKEQWIKGDNNCYGTHPCYAYPEKPITRGEAAALLVRGFGIERTNTSPRFIDVGETDWFAYAIKAMAEHCIIKGDTVTQRIRPQENMNRAEMAVILRRLSLTLKHRDICLEVK
jgi:hypothetical protein